MKIGIISDTHGKVSTKIHEVFEGVDQIWHAGDIGGLDVINEFETNAPGSAGHGQIDQFPIVTKYHGNEIF
ncbi:metallophosphoesterase family protein [candidate division KSB1 bacterium]|nr:metallophosphoesterase family protein [candidate division KSB1 bacterium]